MATRRALPGMTTAALISALAVGCGDPVEPSTEDTGFRVVAVVPLDDDEYAIESVNPELRVTAYADPTSCDRDAVRLVSVGEGNSVVREISYELSFPDNGRKIRMEPEHALANGYWYMITVRSGVWGCTDTNGRMIAPFAARFFVP